VREYFLFDPLGACSPLPLIGYSLIGEDSEPVLPAQRGGLLSVELGMFVVPGGKGLELFHFRTGERVP